MGIIKRIQDEVRFGPPGGRGGYGPPPPYMPPYGGGGYGGYGPPPAYPPRYEDRYDRGRGGGYDDRDRYGRDDRYGSRDRGEGAHGFGVLNLIPRARAGFTSLQVLAEYSLRRPRTVNLQ